MTPSFSKTYGQFYQKVNKAVGQSFSFAESRFCRMGCVVWDNALERLRRVISNYKSNVNNKALEFFDIKIPHQYIYVALNQQRSNFKLQCSLFPHVTLLSNPVCIKVVKII